MKRNYIVKSYFYLIRCIKVGEPIVYMSTCRTRREIKEYVSKLREEYDFVVAAKIDSTI